MRILLINKFHYERDGGTTAYFGTAKVLRAHGHEVAFFSMKHENNLPTEWDKYFVENIDYNEKSQSFFTKAKSAFDLIYNFEARRRLRALINEFKPAIAHLHVIYHQLSPSIIDELKKQGIPMVMTLHDYKQISPNYSLLLNGRIWERSKPKKYYRAVTDKAIKGSFVKSGICALEAYTHDLLGTYGKVGAYISPSLFLKEKYKEYGFKGDIYHVPNVLEAKNGRSSGEYRPNIVYCGRLSLEKGVDDLLYAYAGIKTDSKLLIVGDGPEMNELRGLADRLGIKDKVEFTGHLVGAELIEIIATAGLAVVPSRWYENAPYSVLEAQVSACPVIASRIGGLSELIKNGETGFLYKAGDREELKNTLSMALKLDKGKLEAIGNRARNTVINYNNSGVYYRNLMNVYEKVLG